MVDLVKIRKKAKRVLGVGSGESEQNPADAVTTPPVPKARGKRIVTDAAVSSIPTAAEQPETPIPAPTPHPPLPTPASNKLEQFKATAGQRREGFFEREEETNSADQVELLTFTIAGEQYAVSIEHLVEIITPRAATQVPNADPTIVGIISLRGTIVTVIDVRRKLGHPPAAAGNDTRVIVVERAGEILGFEVDRVLRVLKVDSAAVEPHPVVHSSELTEAVRGVFRHTNALTILLDLDKLLA
ncbi:MAG: chemotaxis protein CheW [Thermoanaerobaculia bacterium]